MPTSPLRPPPPFPPMSFKLCERTLANVFVCACIQYALHACTHKRVRQYANMAACRVQKGKGANAILVVAAHSNRYVSPAAAKRCVCVPSASHPHPVYFPETCGVRFVQRAHRTGAPCGLAYVVARAFAGNVVPDRNAFENWKCIRARGILCTLCIRHTANL